MYITYPSVIKLSLVIFANENFEQDNVEFSFSVTLNPMQLSPLTTEELDDTSGNSCLIFNIKSEGHL